MTLSIFRNYQIPRADTTSKHTRYLSKLPIFLALSLMIAGCAPLQPSRQSSDWVGYTQKGAASYYAKKHQNRKTASGERYDRNLKTAAHRRLPFGTRIRVTNTDNGKSVIATVNDRGPHVPGRIVDLSRSAFDQIANVSSGTIPVELVVLK